MTTATQPTRTHLLEVAILDNPRVDRDKGVIYGVKILGFESRNGRRYEREAVQKAVPLYEGRGVNLDHRKPDDRPGDRSMRDHFGVLRNVVLKEDGLYGDLHYLKSHDEAEALVERAERMSEQIGMSHDAAGQTVRKDGIVVVESIDEVISVDLVLYPATTDGLFESEGFSMAETDDKKKDEPVKEQDVIAAPAAGEEEALFAEQVNGVLNGGGSVDDMKQAMLELCSPKVEEQEGEPVVPKKEEPVAEQGEPEKKEEEPEVKESIDRLQRRIDALEVLTEQRVDRAQLTLDQVDLLHQQQDRKAMTTLVESWPAYLKHGSRPLDGFVQQGPRKKTTDYDELRKELIPK